MTVELAVTIPALLALLGIMVNVLVFLGDCARFDRVAPEAVRVCAASPGYGQYDRSARAAAVESRIRASFAKQGNLSVSVTASAGSGGSSAQGKVRVMDRTIDLLAGTETYTCVLEYRPWGFGDSFFGVTFSGITHQCTYVISAFKPGVLL